MSKAYKCDICGKLFTESNMMFRKWNITANRSCPGICLDLCETCQDKLDNFVENIKKEDLDNIGKDIRGEANEKG